MIKERELLCLLEIALAYGMLPDNWKHEIAQLIANMEAKTDKQPPVIAQADEDAIPPRQLRFWNEQ